MRHLLAVAALLVALARPAAAADPVNAAVQVDRTSINVGDRIALAVIVTADPGYIVNDPTIAREIGSFEVVQTQDVKKTVQGSQVRFTYRYQITAWTLGDLVLPSIAVPFVGPNGSTGTAQTEEVAIKVTSVARAGEDASDIKPLKPQLDLVEPPWTLISRIAVGVAAAIVVTLVVALVLWLLLRRRGALFVEERLTPVQRALRELAALAEQKLPEQGRTSEHYERLCASLRRYAVERFGVQPGRTSREIREALERAGLERTQAGAIYEILREGDEVRFRHSTPYPAHAQNAVRAALEIVRRAASAEEYETAALQPQ